MAKVVVIVESAADARTIIKLAERVILERIYWLESEQLQYHLVWCGLKEGTDHSCWKDVKDIIAFFRIVRYTPPASCLLPPASKRQSLYLINMKSAVSLAHLDIILRGI